MIDTSMIIPIVVVVLIAIVGAPYIIKFIQWFLDRKKNLIERAVDVHGALYKKCKKAAFYNLKALRKKGSAIKKLELIGDPDYPPSACGKVVGIIMSKKYGCTQIFYKPRLLTTARWVITPTVLHRHVHGRVLKLKCNGFLPKANFYIPNFCDTIDDQHPMTEERRNELLKMIDNYERALAKSEENSELIEMNTNAMIDCVDISNRAYPIYTREDSLPTSGGGEERVDEEGA